MSMPGTIAAIDLQGNALTVKKLMFGGTDRIQVWNRVPLEIYDERRKVETAPKTYKYIRGLMDDVIAPWNPDWVIIDSAEYLAEIAEMCMRAKHNLAVDEKFGGNKWSWWGDRDMILEGTIRRARQIGDRGAVLTVYKKEKKKTMTDEGEVVEEGYTPTWWEIMQHKADTLIKTERDAKETGEKIYYADVLSSKAGYSETLINVTNIGFTSVMERRLQQ